jgi:hypothetical protein
VLSRAIIGTCQTDCVIMRCADQGGSQGSGSYAPDKVFQRQGAPKNTPLFRFRIPQWPSSGVALMVGACPKLGTLTAFFTV